MPPLPFYSVDELDSIVKQVGFKGQLTRNAYTYIQKAIHDIIITRIMDPVTIKGFTLETIETVYRDVLPGEMYTTFQINDIINIVNYNNGYMNFTTTFSFKTTRAIFKHYSYDKLDDAVVISLTCFLEYLILEIIKTTVWFVDDGIQKRITPIDIDHTIQMDNELQIVFA